MSRPARFVAPAKDPDTCPLKPIGWRVVIAPYEPDNVTKGGIVLAESTHESERLLTFCGKLVAMGEACFKATTRSGIEMSKWQDKPKIGDWVVYGTYGGQRVVTRSGTRYIITNDDAILAVARSPSDFKYYV